MAAQLELEAADAIAKFDQPPFPDRDIIIFVTSGVIVVTLNYRLGAFGWLAHRALAEDAEKHCPVSRALSAVPISMEAIAAPTRMICM